MIEMEAVERKRSRGGFLNLFDWPGKSRKKLLSSSSTSVPSEELKQEKQNAQNHSKSCPSPIEGDEIGKSSTYIPRRDSSCSTSTVTSDDGLGCRAPSVVARLMGLESLPVSNSLEPRSDPELDPFFLRSSRKASTWNAYENLGYVNLRTDYDGISWDHLDSRTNDKERNRPIERFQTETLPPRSAKPISVTHNRLLSPIRSPGFVPSRNPAYVMDTASRMIEPSSRVAAKPRYSSSDSSSSLPMRIRDLREKLEASAKGLSPQSSNGTRNNKYSRGKQDDKRSTSSLKTQETNKLLGRGNGNGLKNKVKPPSVSAHSKSNTIRKQDSAIPSSSNRGQREKMETKNRVVRSGLKETSARNGKTMVKPTNTKQNQSGVTSVSNQKGSKVMNKVVNKVVVESGTTSKKPVLTATSAEKNTSLSLSRKKNLPRSKKPPNGVQKPGINSDKRIKKGEKLVKCNITVDDGLKTGEDDEKKDMDVISFTFSSPIKGLSSTKTTDQYTESALSFNKMDGDSLNILLEQKLRELSSKLESSCSSLTQEETSSGSITKDWVNGTISLPSDDLDKALSDSESVSDCTSSFYSNRKFQVEEQDINSFNIVTEAEDNHIFCIKRFSSSRNKYETELSESGSLSDTEEGNDWELEYITEIIASGQLMIEELSLGMATDILPLSLFDELESNRNPRGKIERQTLFDFVNECLSLKCEMMFMGRCRVLGKEEILAEEVKREIERLKNMRDMMMDELVDTDMSNGEGKWLDYKKETFEEGTEIEDEIVSDLVDDLINDLLLCCF